MQMECRRVHYGRICVSPWTSRHDLLCDGFRSFRAVRANNSARFSSAIAGDVTRHTKVESDEVDPRHPPSYTGRAKDVVIKIAEEGYVAYVLPRGNECSSERGDWASCSLVSLTQKNSVCMCVYVCVCVGACVLSRTHDDSPIFHVTLFARTSTLSAGYHYPWHKMERKSI